MLGQVQSRNLQVPKAAIAMVRFDKTVNSYLGHISVGVMPTPISLADPSQNVLARACDSAPLAVTLIPTVSPACSTESWDSEILRQ